jgi:hypothetical protein
MKRVLLLLVLIILMASCSQKRSQNIEWIPFTWESGFEWGKYVDKMAIYVPVEIGGIPCKLIMQLDLGTYSTVFYEKALKPFLEKYPSLNQKWDFPLFRNVDLKLGEVVFEGIDVGLYKNIIHPDAAKFEEEIEIGAIGADLVQNKVVVIDYKSNRLSVTDALPAKYQNTSFVTFIIDSGLIKLPFRINGNMEYLLFDTGGSYFCMATTKQNALAIGGTEIVDSLTATGWDRYIPFFGLETVAPVIFGERIMESSIVYYTEGEGFDDIYKSLNVWGLAGNGFFLNDVIIIDYKNKRFGVNGELFNRSGNEFEKHKHQNSKMQSAKHT